MLKKIPRWLAIGIYQISGFELFAIALNVVAFILYGVTQNFYLWLLVVLCDFMVVCAHGAWVDVGGDHVFGPWRTPAPLLTRLASLIVLLILAYEHYDDSILSTYAWYIIVIAAICHAFYCILLTMHESNPSWLAGTQGRIGIPNWISIIRMALSVLVPHLYAAQPFGSASSFIASCTLIAAIATDAADGYIARRFNQTTKAGKALDPLGDKVIFYPTAIAFVIATHGTGYLTTGPLRITLYVCLAIMFLRDFIFTIWFFAYYHRLGASGIGAGIVDKVRMAAMCVWLGTSAFALTFTSQQQRLALAGLISICLVAILSLVSLFVDYHRIRPLLDQSKTPRASKSARSAKTPQSHGSQNHDHNV